MYLHQNQKSIANLLQAEFDNVINSLELSLSDIPTVEQLETILATMQKKAAESIFNVVVNGISAALTQDLPDSDGEDEL